MENKNIKPTFGVTVAQNSLNDDRRQELGAIWEKTSRNNRPFLNVKLNLPKSKLLELLAKCQGEEINVNLIAFPNDHKQQGDNRPSFRIYEEQK